MKNQLLVNIGNTHATLHFYENGQFSQAVTYPSNQLTSEEVLEHSLLSQVTEIFIASVKPAIHADLRENWPDTLHFLDWQTTAQWIDFSLVDPTTIGADRLANAIAGRTLFPGQSVIIVDCGTCLTTELVNADGQFLGGAIIPGRQLQRQALNLHTGQLPAVDLTAEIPPPFGTNTAEAIKALDTALASGLKHLIQESVEKMGETKVILTGGDAAYFLPVLTEFDTEIIPDLTLIGLKAVMDHI